MLLATNPTPEIAVFMLNTFAARREGRGSKAINLKTL